MRVLGERKPIDAADAEIHNETNSSDSVPKAHSILTDEAVTSAVHEEFGANAEVVSWRIQDFTKKGDNYSSYVTSIQVELVLDGQKKQVSYVAKLNPCQGETTFSKIIMEKFCSEGSFFRRLLPKLNKLLTGCDQDNLRIPTCLYESYEKDNETLICKDLRERGFRMIDHRKGQDVSHVTLVMKELGRLHAASKLLMDKEGDLLKNNPYLQDVWETNAEDDKLFFVTIMQNQMRNSIALLASYGGYEKSLEIINKFILNLLEYVTLLMRPDDKFSVVNHGDTWNNNMLFRYDLEGNPIEVMMVDLQFCKVSSFAIDLNYFIYTSMAGDVRQQNFNQFLEIYYNSFKNVMNAANKQMPFTLEECKEEFENKTGFGLYIAMFSTPIMLMEDEESSFNIVESSNIQEYVEDYKMNMMKMMQENPNFKSRFLTIFDELTENGRAKLPELNQL